MSYVIVRTARAGCFCGYIESEEGNVVILQQARRLWYWSGAASLSQLAVVGTSNPAGCKFPAPVVRAKLFEVLEILDTSEQARLNIAKVPEWKV
jgi:hypothetical protein